MIIDKDVYNSVLFQDYLNIFQNLQVLKKQKMFKLDPKGRTWQFNNTVFKMPLYTKIDTEIQKCKNKLRDLNFDQELLDIQTSYGNYKNDTKAKILKEKADSAAAMVEMLSMYKKYVNKSDNHMSSLYNKTVQSMYDSIRPTEFNPDEYLRSLKNVQSISLKIAKAKQNQRYVDFVLVEMPKIVSKGGSFQSKKYNAYLEKYGKYSRYIKP
jgi:hypothetical protein